MAIISTSDFKTYRGISASTYDTLIGVLITAAQAQAERYCDRVFDSATFTELHNGDGTNIVVVRNTPITSLTTVKLVDSAGTKTTLDSDSYVENLETGVIKLAGEVYGWSDIDDADPTPRRWSDLPCFPRGHQNVEVVYVGGYSSQTMPADLKMAMYLLVDSMYAASYATGGSPTAFKSEQLGDYNYTNFDQAANLVQGNGGMVSAVFAKFASMFNPWRRAST